MINSPFVGLKYVHVAIYYKADILNALKNTFAISGLGILLSPLPVLFAIMLSEAKNVRFKKMVQTVSAFPNFISWVIVFGLIWGIFSADGSINFVLMKLHLIHEPTNVLGNAGATWYFQAMLTVWKGMGYSAIIYLAAIAGIPQDIYEASYVDGAGRFKRMWHITLPAIKPTIAILLILNSGYIIHGGFEQQLLMYNPLVMDYAEVINTYVYKRGINAAEYSFATAVGVFQSAVSIVLIIAVNKITKKMVDVGLW